MPMFSPIHYLLRSKFDGEYLVARLRKNEQETETRYLLLFPEDFDALSYLNTHGAAVANRFSVESVSQTQLKGILKRWGFAGIGLVKEPIEPNIQFLVYESL